MDTPKWIHCTGRNGRFREERENGQNGHLGLNGGIGKTGTRLGSKKDIGVLPFIRKRRVTPQHPQ